MVAVPHATKAAHAAFAPIIRNIALMDSASLASSTLPDTCAAPFFSARMMRVATSIRRRTDTSHGVGSIRIRSDQAAISR